MAIFPPSTCFNHWVVTEDGKIEHQVRNRLFGGVSAKLKLYRLLCDSACASV